MYTPVLSQTLLKKCNPQLQLRAKAPVRLSRTQIVRAAPEATADVALAKRLLFDDLSIYCDNVRRAPFVMKLDYSKDVMSTMKSLKEMGALKKWGSVAEEDFPRRNVFVGELRQVGVKNPEKIAIPSVRNDAAFLYTTVGVFSVLAVIAGQLPGDWGFFGAYLIGGVPIVVLAIGSTAPGLLQVIIDKFAQLFPDYKERVLRHEAAHFLIGYLLGVPITDYSVALGQEHIEFADFKLQQRIIERMLEDKEIDILAQVAVAGMAAEGQAYDEVEGQTADLSDLQRILLRSKTKLTDAAQQNITRWAVFRAGSLLKTYKKEHDALIAAMARGAKVVECMEAIEAA